MPVQGTHFTLEVDGQAPETFAVVSFRHSQSYSSLFSLEIVAASSNPAVSFQELLESNATLTISRNAVPQRRIRGIVTGCEQGDSGKHQTLYTLSIHPPFWRSALRRNSRIFQNVDIKSIVSTLFGEMLVKQWEPRFSAAHPVREFCVQFMETDYDFISRLLAEEGIFTYEEESGGVQTLVLSDSAASLPDGGGLDYHPEPGEETTLYHVMQFRRSAQIRPAKVTTQDYTFKTPSWPGQFKHQGDNLDSQYPVYEIFDYPGRFKDEVHGKAFTQYQTEGWRNNAEMVTGLTDSPKLWPGVRFGLREHPRADLNTQWQVVSSELIGEQPQALIGHEGQGTTLTNYFQVIPGKQTWRPTPLPKPQVDGPQTAVVTGPPGEEIFCDEHGRVRVKFTWDRYNPADDSSSCWIRVSQAWAGAGFGNLAIPRVGQEVIVDFLNGDPDQPIVMGRTYHADNKSPGSLPGSKTQMTLRSKTYKGGGYNELMFEDATNQELLSMHAQKDMKTVVENDRTTDVKNDDTTTITHDQRLTVNNEQHTTVKKDCTRTVTEGSHFVTVEKGEQHIKVNTGQRSLFVANGHSVTVKDGGETNTIQNGGQKNTIKGDRFLTVQEGNQTTDIAGKLDLTVGDAITITCGAAKLEIKNDGSVTLNGVKFTFIASGEVKVEGKEITLN
ncbi:type VI secretion system tip protein VgrG [Salmonella enterica]|nr:type VI secretion system tip protein VgrG [Salmonella enterica]EAX6603040.1 type VI secretion system tip protein VgrG [Salmonella enterica]